MIYKNIHQNVVDKLKQRLSKITYLCSNIEFDGKEDGYYCFDAVDLSNCEVSLRFQIDNTTECDKWILQESYGDNWSIVTE